MSSTMKAFPRWIAVAQATALLVLIIGGAWFYHGQERALQLAAEEQLTSIARLKVHQITAWRAERLGDAAVLVESQFLGQGVARFLADPDDANTQPLRSRLRSLQAHYQYVDALLVDPHGIVLLSLTGETALHEECRAALATALSGRKPVLSELYIGTQTPAPHLSVVAPIFAGDAPDAPPLGLVVLISDASQFLYPLMQSWPTPSKTAETLLIRRDGEDALFLNDLRHQPDAALKRRIPLSRADVPAVMAVLGRQGVFQGRDYRGVAVLAALLPVPDSPWFLVAKQDKAEVFVEWRLRAYLILALFVAMAGGIAAMGLVAWQRRKNVYYEALYHSEARLRESEQKFRQLFENMASGFALHKMIYAPNGEPVDYRFIEINPAFEKLTGLQAQNLIGRTVKEVLPKTEQYWIDTFGKVAQSGEPVSFENYAQEFGRHFDVRAFSPAPQMFATVFSDITERKRAEEEVRLSHLKKIESLGRMAGGIAHHYNNLMSIVMGNLEMAQADLPGDSGPTEALTAAMKAAGRAAELAGMMLTYLGLTFAWPKPLDLSETCRGLLPVLLASLPKHVTLETDLPEPGPVVKADAGQIRQMLHALVANAWEAMGGRPGIVFLNVRHTSPADISTTHRRPVEFQPNAPWYACLEVKDTGCGIAQSDFEKLFDPFYSTKFTGRGLGLSVVLGAAKAHDGCITLESELGRGSIFRIFLPLDTEAAAPPQNNRRTDDV